MLLGHVDSFQLKAIEDLWGPKINFYLSLKDFKWGGGGVWLSHNSYYRKITFLTDYGAGQTCKY